MLAQEWRELEMLCEHMSELRERRSAAEKTGNTGLVEGLNREMDRVARMRDQLVRYISARLGSAAVAPFRGSGPAPRPKRPANHCNAVVIPERE
jgi:hypothetical protein